MKKIDIFQIPFYEFQCDKNLVEKIEEDVSLLNYIIENDSNGYVSHNYYHRELFKWFNECIEQMSRLYFTDTLKFPIVDCWANKYTALTRLKKHRHLNSVICGCYYASTNDSGNTIFEYPNPWADQNSFLSINKSLPPLEAEIKPISGTLILFPSNLYHYMKPYKDKSKPKYTIAFNTFPSGVISDHSTAKLELKTLSIEEKNSSEKI